jgi:hypothetical protein
MNPKSKKDADANAIARSIRSGRMVAPGIGIGDAPKHEGQK